MRLAVFTSGYPAQTATFFERDMRALAAAGVRLDIFSVTPLDASLLHSAASGAAAAPQLPQGPAHIFRLTLGQGLRAAAPVLARRTHPALSDASRALVAAARYGPRALSRTASVLPKAWAWSAATSGVQYDHVLGYWGDYAGTCAYAFHRLLPRPVPFTLWLHAGTDLYASRAFLRQKLAYADLIVTCCEFNRDYIRREFARVPGVASRVRVSHHGLDLAEFRFQAAGRAPAAVVAVGPLLAWKGFDFLLRAQRELAGRGTWCTVDIVGDGPEREGLARLARELGLDARVRFRGWLSAADTRAAIAAATLLVHPSGGLGDGLPNVVREAMAVGTPVVASAIAGIPDALGDGCGVLVPPRDVGALADAIAALLADPGSRATLAARARQRVETRYDLWRNGQRLAALLANTVRERRAPSGLTPALVERFA